MPWLSIALACAPHLSPVQGVYSRWHNGQWSVTESRGSDSDMSTPMLPFQAVLQQSVTCPPPPASQITATHPSTGIIFPHKRGEGARGGGRTEPYNPRKAFWFFFNPTSHLPPKSHHLTLSLHQSDPGLLLGCQAKVSMGRGGPAPPCLGGASAAAPIPGKLLFRTPQVLIRLLAWPEFPMPLNP